MKKLGIVLVVFVATIAIIMSFVIPSGEKKVLKRLHGLNIYPSTRLINYADSLKIKVTVVGDSTKHALLLIHGSPGDWSAWENVISNDSVRSMFYILAVDRAGYGGTTVPALNNLHEHAAVVWQVLSQMKIDSSITLAGHSYGGAVVEQLLIEHPEAFNLGIFVAPTLSPEYMQPKWYNKVAKWSVVNLIISKDLKASNFEMLGLPASLKLNESLIPSIDIPLVYIQGKKDILVDPETVDYFSKMKPDGVQYVIIEDMNHFTPWSHPYLINDAILGKSEEK
jgi:pimeloyl-ACP methyl ester carboxylesterase